MHRTQASPLRARRRKPEGLEREAATALHGGTRPRVAHGSAHPAGTACEGGVGVQAAWSGAAGVPGGARGAEAGGGGGRGSAPRGWLPCGSPPTSGR